MTQIDTLIQNAMVFDGSGAEPEEQDVAVHQGTILAVGKNLAYTAKHCVDAKGLALMPWA